MLADGIDKPELRLVAKCPDPGNERRDVLRRAFVHRCALRRSERNAHVLEDAERELLFRIEDVVETHLGRRRRLYLTRCGVSDTDTDTHRAPSCIERAVHHT